jgi:hypothetical protein
MNAADWGPAAICVALGVRSAVHWLRRPLGSTDPRDHALFALFLVARLGSWLLLAVWFAALGSVAADVRGETLLRSVPDELARYRWVAAAFFISVAVAFAASYFLARRDPGRSEGPDDAGPSDDRDRG